MDQSRHLLLVICLLFSMSFSSVAAAAINDSCSPPTGGIVTDSGGTCTDPATLNVGSTCSGNYFYNGSSCVLDGASCSTFSLPGTYSSGLCSASSTPTSGMSCGGNDYYNGTSCVTNGTSSGSCSAPNVWSNGSCVAPAPSPTPPATTGSLGNAVTALRNVAGNTAQPGAVGGQQPVCVNTSPVITYGFGVSVGTALCYGTAADLSGTSMYAYHTSDSQNWDGLNLQDLYARGDITALGTLNVYGGAVITSPDQYTGLVVGNSSVLIGSSSGSNSASFTLTPNLVTTSVTDGTHTSSVSADARSVVIAASKSASETSSLNLDAVNGISASAKVATGTAAAITINGIVSGTNSSKTGVLITGDGNGNSSGTVTDGVANWADVLVQSKNYATGYGNANGLGSAIIVNDYGIQIVSPALTGNGNTTTTNSFGSGESNSSGTTVNNNIGHGGGGSVNNTLGAAGVPGSTTVNNIGTDEDGLGGSTTNNIGNTNTGTTINAKAGTSSFGMQNGQISMSAGTPLATNGTTGITSASGSGGMTILNSATSISAGTTVADRLAGKQYQNKINGNLFLDGNLYINGTLDYISSDSANTTVTNTGNIGTSILTGASMGTSGGTAIVMRGTDAPHAVVDRNGKITNTTGTASQSSASMTLTNGYGNTHGIIIDEQQTTISGGVYSTSLTLKDYEARFSNTKNGRPITVTGVADGRNDYDAVNVRQLRNVAASAAAMSNIPSLDSGKEFSIGLGLGSWAGQTAYALAMSMRPTENLMLRGSVSTDAVNDSKPMLGIGAALSW